jgi:hypothetical protein
MYSPIPIVNEKYNDYDDDNDSGNMVMRMITIRDMRMMVVVKGVMIFIMMFMMIIIHIKDYLQQQM